jgi:lysosomal acid lipase/cholesteryl ester hydrolase
MMCSEVWVSCPDFNESLAFTLAEAGYDVWLGNTRGNKYSCKHKTRKPTDEIFWDFCMDELAKHDLPDSIDVITSLSIVYS